MDYRDAVKYMDSNIQFGICPGLERIQTLCKKLGNPHKSYKTIHIAGTNGKTSTARIASAILRAHGLKVGTYTSPHLVLYTERFLINDKPITKKLFTDCLSTIIPYIKEVNKESAEPLTHFEILTALAFYLFAQENLDCAVIETGMGGRWDATNIIFPRVAALTNVSLEHTDRLGKTVAKIAWEKAHIIKEGCMALAGSMLKEALNVIKRRCAEEEVELKVLSSDFWLLEAEKVDFQSQELSVQGLRHRYDHLLLPLAGEHQAKNTALAIAMSEEFLQTPLSLKQLKIACRKVKSPGRFEVVSRDPLIVLDGAHNPAGAAQLAKTLDQTGIDHIVLVLAILEDKDIDKMLEELIPRAHFTIVTENDNERCVKAVSLAGKVKKLTTHFEVKPDVREAIKLAVSKAKRDDLVLITGSLYTVGESKEYLKMI